MSQKVPFIGRDKEIAHIVKSIEQWDETKAFFLNAEGGIGKTRLLQEIRKMYKKYPEPLNYLGGQMEDYAPEKIRDIRFRIGLVMQFSKPEWSMQFLDGAREMADELGVELIEKNADFDIEKMAAALDELTEKRLDAVIVDGGNEERLKPALKKAVQKTKVLTFVNMLRDIEGVVTRVSQDDLGGARLSVEELAKDIGYEGKIAVVWNEDFAPLKARKEILDSIQKRYPDITVVKDFGALGDDIIEQVKTKTMETLEEYPDIKAVWATWDEFAKGVHAALTERDRLDISLHSFDLCPSDIQKIAEKDSPWKSTVAANAVDAGQTMVRLAVMAVLGFDLKKQYFLPMKMFTQQMIRNVVRQEKSVWEESSEAWNLLLRTMRKQKEQTPPPLIVTPIIDFDDPELQFIENINRNLLNTLGKDHFETYLNDLVTYSRELKKELPEKRKKEELAKLSQSFAQCFNQVSKDQRVILFMDTTDHIKNIEYFIEDLDFKITSLKNAVFLIAGRNNRQEIAERLNIADPSLVEIIDLHPFNEDESRKYLNEKKQIKLIDVEPDIEEKFILLSNGRPILIDLAVEWRSRGIHQEWFLDESLDKDIVQYHKTGNKESLEKWYRQFEKELVLPFKDIRTPMDRLIMLLSYFYPLNKEMIAEFLELEPDAAEKLYRESKKYIFIKELPNGYISLHDEMTRMFEDHVWPEIDSDESRREWYSSLVVDYLPKQIDRMEIEIGHRRNELRKLSETEDEKEIIRINIDIDELEDSLWIAKKQMFEHALKVDLDKSFELFEELFDWATHSSRITERYEIFRSLEQNKDRFSGQQRSIYDIHRAKFEMFGKKYTSARDICLEILKNSEISKERRVETLILLGNIRIRIGEITDSIPHFREALTICKGNKDLYVQMIKSENALGWAHLLTGKLQIASNHLASARHLCYIHGGPENKELQTDFGWISNNLAFVLSERSKTRQNAIDIALETVDHWRKIQHDIGLGAAYHVLGVAYYRSGFFDLSLESYNKALELFKPPDDFKEWRGLIFSWRGALYTHLERYEEAERELKEAKEIGTQNRHAMTLYRLIRLYIYTNRWELADRYIAEAYEHALKTPDYRYGILLLGRLVEIAIHQKDYGRLSDFEKELLDWTHRIEKTDDVSGHAVALTHFFLALYIMVQNDASKIEVVYSYFKNGILMMTDYGFYAKAGVHDRLKYIEERYFMEIEPDIIRAVGQKLLEFSSEKEIQDISFTSITQCVYRWANWQRGNQG